MGGSNARAKVLYGLAGASRIALVRELAEGEARVKDLSDSTGLPPSNTSYQLGYLWDAGLLAREPRGVEAVYRLIPGALEPLDAADALLARTVVTEGSAHDPRAGGGRKTQKAGVEEFP